MRLEKNSNGSDKNMNGDSKRKYSVIDVLMVIGIVFIGADVFGFSLGNMNIRFIQIYYIFFSLLIYFKYKTFLVIKSKCFALFIVFFILSVFLSINIVKSLQFLLWVIYNYIFVTGLFYSYIKIRGAEQFEKIFRFSFSIISFVVLIVFFLSNFFGIKFPFFVYQEYMGIVRPALWFYEPSYLATFLSIYLSFSFYKYFILNDRKYLFHSCISTFSVILTTASTGFVALFITFIIVFFLKIINKKYFINKAKYLLFGMIIICVLIILLKQFFPDIYETFVKRVFNSNLSASTGGRVDSYEKMFSIFLSKPLFGIGPNTYGLFLGDENLQCTNISLELLCTTGVFSFFFFVLWFLEPLYKIRKENKLKKKYNNTSAYFFSLVILLVVLQANQNYLRLYLWMLPGIINAIFVKEKYFSLVEN